MIMEPNELREAAANAAAYAQTNINRRINKTILGISTLPDNDPRLKLAASVIPAQVLPRKTVSRTGA